MRFVFLVGIGLPVLAPAAIDFSREIRPILSENCFFCHGPDEKKREAGLRLDEEAAAKASNDGVSAVVPGDPEKSALIQRIVSTDPDEVMPPPKLHKVIPAAQVALLKEWIRQGAPWGKHWSYERVARPSVPKVEQKGAPLSPIDAFLAARLVKEGLAFSAEADAATLIRRVALDLTGLPPTLEELARLSHAPYEAVVDHYLSRPAFGEHWASQWLDLARYADSSGYPSDQPREIWAYRDWVIRALNANLPFDQFTREQLAGDLLPNPSDDQLIATAFHRNTMTQNEGGTSDEEFRNAAVIDRVNTTFAVWMGTTMACAQCHTHKYDPLTLKEYFQAYAFLNQSADSDKKDETPLHSFETAELKQQRAELRASIAALEARLAQPEPKWLAGLAGWDKNLRQELAWQAAEPLSMSTQSGRKAAISKEGWVTLSAKATKDIYTLELPLQTSLLTALRLETQPTSGHGNFVLTQMKAELLPPPNAMAPKARFARVELPGKGKMLQLAEVQVSSGGQNVSLRKPAKQSSTYAGAVAGRAVDGQTEGDYAKGSVSHTSGQEDHPWWEVDLLQEWPVDQVALWNRTDGGTGKRLEGVQVVLLDAKRQLVWKSTPQPAPEKERTVQVSGPVPLTFSQALADHEQSGFTAASVLRPPDRQNQGWAIAPQVDRPHALTLLAATPIQVPAGSRLRVMLEQKSVHLHHTLGRFRLLSTDDARARQAVALPGDVLAAIHLAPEKRSPAQSARIQDHYVRHIAPENAAERQELAARQKQLAELKPVTVPIMKDLTGKERRITKVQLRGNWQALGEVVSEGTPAIFPPLPADAPRNRLTLANWLVSRDNPLTARVQVNRLWETLFGTGIVRTSEEFGSQGELPFHPELLDWLAAEFMDSGWDVKHLVKLMVMSRAYRQVSATTAELAARDPDNRLLARGPRFRPTGEMLRDQALAVSGLLSAKMHGPGVRPPAPNLGLSTAFGRSNDWTTSEGEDRYRRSVYTEVRRNAPYASFTTFDAGNREVCMIRRNRTNTPLQAFVTLNDPVFIETHQALARRVVRAAKDDASRFALMFKLCVSREPTAQELATLSRLLAESLVSYRQDQESAKKMATEPLGPAPADADLPTLAAWTTVANVVMNLDEFVMRR